MRQSWTDDRMDDLVKRVDDGFAHVDQRFQQVDMRFEQFSEDCRELRREMTALGNELRSEQTALAKEMRTEIKDLGASMNQRFNGFDRRFDMAMATMVTGFIGLIVSSFL